MIRKMKFTSIPVRDQDRAVNFYVNILGFILQTDQPMGPGFRWIELRPPKGDTGIALFTPPALRIGSERSREYLSTVTMYKRHSRNSAPRV